MTTLIVPILKAVRDSIRFYTIDNVAVTDPARADNVKIGHLYQENPTRPEANIYATVSHGKRDDPGYRDAIVTTKDMENIGLFVRAREIGGGVFWWRRGTVEYGVFLTKSNYTEEQAFDIAMTFYQRVLRGIEKANVTGLQEDFERAYKLFLVASSFYEQGGLRQKTYIWRGTAYFQVLTQRHVP